MARLIERNFDPRKEIFVRRNFTANAKKFDRGSAFNWRQIALDVKAVKRLYDAGYLYHEENQPATKQEYTPEPIKPEYTPKSEDQEILSVASGDDLDAIDDMKELRAIANEIGAGYKVSKVDQREAIRAKRKENDQ